MREYTLQWWINERAAVSHDRRGNLSTDFAAHPPRFSVAARKHRAQKFAPVCRIKVVQLWYFALFDIAPVLRIASRRLIHHSVSREVINKRETAREINVNSLFAIQEDILKFS